MLGGFCCILALRARACEPFVIQGGLQVTCQLGLFAVSRLAPQLQQCSDGPTVMQIDYELEVLDDS
jgi:hypothetical protein